MGSGPPEAALGFQSRSCVRGAVQAMEVIKAQGLTKLYKNNRGIVDLQLSIESNMVFGLLGPNGSGKTTAMKVMAGLLYPRQGTVTLFGKKPSEDRPAIMARTGCMIEEPGLYPYLNAEQHLLMLQRLYPHVDREYGTHLLKQLELYEYRRDKVSRYSMGMKQRLAFALALYGQPELLILDEPTNGMDISGTALVRSILQEQVEQGGTIFISSHLAHEIEQICTHVGIMDKGRMLESVSVSTILAQYQSIEAYYLAVVARHKKKEAAA